jgi:hypothetical protein
MNYADTINRLDNKAQIQGYAEQDQQQEAAKKNHDFVQFTRKGLVKLSSLRNGIALQLFLFLTKEMNGENCVLVSQQTLANYLDVSRVTILKAVGDLVDAQLIDIMKIGNQNIYCLNAHVVWTRERDKLNLARFKANIVISQEEQAKIKATRKNSIKQISLDLTPLQPQ